MVRKFLGAEPPLAQNPGSATETIAIATVDGSRYDFRVASERYVRLNNLPFVT
jgi:hypothetical protein